MTIVALVLLFSGFFFIVVAALGVIRFPDFYTRLHAAGKGDTLGIALFVLGLAVYNGFNFVSLKLLLIVLFVFLANPIGGHVLSRAAFRSGLKPWTKKGE
ncbi:MAG TPA: monovalent cation/H(+) antiporter subunit G [Clostridia bacterium]|jgi:multicomponent Na+:H+ antiporter subunit G|nr:monovalent cation/H(+) antiporter subunit G [Clostridia bacterium]HHY05917.1 monovalent cation/H(+) antiporter subunit G [Clostridia bacterium]